MPNSRRRRFSVQHNIGQSNASKVQNSSQSSVLDADSKSKAPPQNIKQTKSKNKVFPNSLRIFPELDAVVECESTTSLKMDKITSADKDVTASSSNIDLYNLLSISDYNNEQEISAETLINQLDSDKRSPRQMTRRERYLRQHRVKVRSPKRRTTVADSFKNEYDTRVTVGLCAIDWDQEVEELVEHVNATVTECVTENRISSQSLDDMCRICHGGEALSPELGQMISACACRGTVGRVHVKCLERWLTESGKSRCELCGTRYATRRVHRYGLPKALLMWVLSQNAKQLMVDSLGIMLMSPLAVLAAWLSGRTLAGLMTPESHVTPWPLASTFVLACMTLVCYYCWIVSAATRHALGWWIWYRSQYEVRLQFQENEE